MLDICTGIIQNSFPSPINHSVFITKYIVNSLQKKTAYSIFFSRLIHTRAYSAQILRERDSLNTIKDEKKQINLLEALKPCNRVGSMFTRLHQFILNFLATSRSSGFRLTELTR